MTTMTPTQPKRWTEITAIWKDNRWLYAMMGILLGILVTPAVEQITGDLNDLIGNLVPEAVGIVFTVLILDRLGEMRADTRSKNERKQNLFRLVKSRPNNAAIQAIEQIRDEGLWDELLAHYQDKNGKPNFAHVQWAGNIQLEEANLENAYLMRANLEGANLINTNLENSYLVDANLGNADLGDAKLEHADISYANLENAHIGIANLRRANLYHANLKNADLYYANLENTDLSKVDFEGANLHNVNFENADLYLANLRDTTEIEAAHFNEKTVLPDAQCIDDDYLIYDKYWTTDTDMTRYTNPDHPDFWEPDWVKKQGEQGNE